MNRIIKIIHKNEKILKNIRLLNIELTINKAKLEKIRRNSQKTDNLYFLNKKPREEEVFLL